VQLSKKEFESLRSARLALMEMVGAEATFHVLMENYVELEESVLKEGLRHMVYSSDKRKDAAARHLISRRILNFMSSARLYLDALPQHCDRFFYDKLYFAKMKAIVSDVYDQSLGHRVMEALRNYSQHFDLPVHALVARSDREKDISKRVAVSVVPQLNIPLLSLGGHFKRTVLAELAQCGKFVDLLPLTREYVDGLRRIHKEFRTMAKRPDRAYESLMGRTTGRYLTGRGGVPKEIIAVAKKTNGIAESIYVYSSALYDLSWKQEKVDQLNKRYLKW
jgi:hypothetical protein